MAAVREMIREAAAHDEPVFVSGEPGTGKELVAREIHALSGRNAGPFEAVNIGVLPIREVGRTLFGSGGEGPSRRGCCMRDAAKGVLFLDEVGAIPYPAQTGLLRMLRDGPCAPRDWKNGTPEVRLIVGTTHDLEEEMRQRRFRPDLLFLLQACRIHVPPLRERAEDIPALAAHFARYANRQFGLSVEGVSGAAESALGAYDWPGNIRELRMAVTHAALMCDEGPIQPEHLPRRLARRAPETAIV
jgi:two-component system NtrC family response regulator